MNTTQRQAIDSAISTAEDNLYRAELELRRAHNPQLASSKATEYIAELKRQLAALQEGLQ